jgi:hypothetical protein
MIYIRVGRRDPTGKKYSLPQLNDSDGKDHA